MSLLLNYLLDICFIKLKQVLLYFNIIIILYIIIYYIILLLLKFIDGICYFILFIKNIPTKIKIKKNFPKKF